MMNWSRLLAAVIAQACLASFVSAAEFPVVLMQAPQVAESIARGETAEPKAERPDFDKGPAPQWIWGPETDNQPWFFRHEFDAGEVRSAQVIASGDNRMTVWLNGAKVLQGVNWQTPESADVGKHLKSGKNTLLVEAANEGGVAAFVLKLVQTSADGKSSFVVTGKNWQASRQRDGEKWTAVKTLGKLGVQPWGNVFSQPQLADGPRNVFQVPPGFQVELLFSVPKEQLGSWVAITFDGKGRLIASDQGDKGLCRITPPPIGSDEPTRVEKLDVNMTAAQGLLHAFGSLYCSVNGGPGSGFYRLTDTDGDDQYDEVKKLQSFKGGGEHGPHAIRLSPDGKSLYVICGNHTDPVEFDSSRVPSNWGEDLLLPRQWDARGHARGRMAPGGWIAKTDPEGKTWEIVSVGYRNAYDMAFNADGELFAYDADMEWDMGAPWYRPTRLCHATSGSEFGWRSGTGKWPTYFVDSLPPVVDIGPGSPVGVEFGYGTKFPAKYQKALYLLDWTFGTIYAVHLTPDGASYKGETEEFLSRTPLPLTDAAVGPDGALYFTIGGRGTQSELYRVTYTGKESTTPVEGHNPNGHELRTLRRQLEAFHQAMPDSRDGEDPVEYVRKHEANVAFIGKHLAHEDRFVRYAARVALEFRGWPKDVLETKDAQTLITAAVAMARQGSGSDFQPQLAGALGKLDFQKLTKTQKLELLRAWALVFIRLGEPSSELARQVASQLDAHFPADDEVVNWELARLLVYLKSPTVVTKTMALMEREAQPTTQEIDELLARNPGYGGSIAQMLANQPDKNKLFYGFILRNVRYGWTLEQRQRYFEILAEQRTKSGGASFQGFIDNIRKESLANASEAERKALEGRVTLKPPALEELPKAQGPGHDWAVAEIVQLTSSGISGRDFENGRKMYAAAQCVRCHRFEGQGGATGPDLTNVAGRFGFKDLAEALIEPSKVVSDQYRAVKILTASGKPYTGRILANENGTLTVLTDPVDATKIVEIDKADVELIEPSTTSLMPKDLVDTLNEQELLDLFAYLLSRGNPQDPMFR